MSEIVDEIAYALAVLLLCFSPCIALWFPRLSEDRRARRDRLYDLEAWYEGTYRTADDKQTMTARLIERQMR